MRRAITDHHTDEAIYIISDLLGRAESYSLELVVLLSRSTRPTPSAHRGSLVYTLENGKARETRHTSTIPSGYQKTSNMASAASTVFHVQRRQSEHDGETRRGVSPALLFLVVLLSIITFLALWYVDFYGSDIVGPLIILAASSCRGP